jgi:ABC-type transport system substrate-binding protein
LAGTPSGSNVPYDEWTDQLKADYGYDPDRAEKLLDEAGYARGAAGVRFKTQLHTRISPSADLDWTQAAKDYWAQIGVDALMPITALRINSVNVPTTVVADHPTAVPDS